MSPFPTLPALLLLVATTIPTPTLVLRSGAHIDVDGSVSQEESRVVFRSHGVLYSLAADQVDFDATRAAGMNVTIVRAENRGKLKVSKEERDRLLRELEQNHNGSPADPNGMRVAPPTTPEQVEGSGEEWTWRRNARGYEENLRRAKEDLQLLVSRADQLREQIRNFVSLGYKPNQFTYQTSELQTTYDAMPRAQLEVDRAQRALDQFRDDARRMGVMPGWLR